MDSKIESLQKYKEKLEIELDWDQQIVKDLEIELYSVEAARVSIKSKVNEVVRNMFVTETPARRLPLHIQSNSHSEAAAQELVGKRTKHHEDDN